MALKENLSCLLQMYEFCKIHTFFLFLITGAIRLEIKTRKAFPLILSLN